jgi:NDP-4-keto-2,6-dideoxyhexose 3-C-methyltransferase
MLIILCSRHQSANAACAETGTVAHLRGKAARIKQRVALTSGDAILDIGSNDATFLATLIEPGVTALGMDPSAEKFRKYYRPEIQIIPEFFSAAGFRRHFGAQKLKVVTSIAMFYESCTRNLNRESITESL